MSFFSEEDQDRVALMITGPSILLGLIGGSTAWIMAKGYTATAWLMAHKILVPKEEAMISFLDAGLDLARLALIAVLVVLMLWGLIASARRRRA